MKLIIFATLIVLASALEDEISSKIKDKRQILLGGLGYGGLAYGGLGYGLGAFPYGGVYPGYGVIGRKRREVAEDIEEVDDESKEKRHLLLGHGVLPVAGYGYGLPIGGYGYGLGLGYGAVDTGFGIPAVIGRKRREVAEETDESTKEKRQLLLGGYGLAGYGLGYGLPVGGYGLGLGYGLGGYPAVIGRKRRDVAEEESTKEKRQILLGGYGLGGYGLGYGLPVGGYGLGLGYGLGGFPAVYGRKRRDVDEVADKAAHEKRQVLLGAGAYPVGGIYPGGVVPAVGAYPVGGVVPAVGAYPVGGVVGAYPAVGVGAPGVLL